ncbi:hypothetical protein CKAH01_17173 [Colletotrichum kahawae]|uniref:RING-type domain-containing protein n=1 Tax=Colletotrichum kahawae TaxID=34407 RepID=A0AAE0D4E8_COLKA|nr:hypothetical protein CKAH01_17173 [Colletotrichum kahawae]
MAWLQLRTNAPGLPGAFIVEDRSVYRTMCASKVLTFLTCPKSDAEDVNLRKLDDESFVIECPLFSTIRTRVKAGPVSSQYTKHFLDRITPSPIVVKQLYAQVFCPLSHLVALFVDDLGGLSKSAEVLASLLHEWNTLGMSSPPCLLVVTDDGDITEDAFIREVTLHYLELLRLSSTDMPPIYIRAKSTWTSSFQSITIVAAQGEDLHYHLVIYSEEVYRHRQQSYLAFSPETFHELVLQAVYRMGGDERLNIVGSLRSESQQLIPSLFVPYMRRLLRTQDGFPDFNWQSLLASSLAVDSHRSSHHIFQAELVFEEVYELILHHLAREVRQPDLAAVVKQHFCNLVKKAEANPQALLHNHLNLLRNHNDLLTPSKACGMCHLRVPTHTATCQHKLCDSCADLLGHQSNDTQHSACLICLKGDILIKPRSVAVRALILHGRTPRATIGFLFRLRRALLGPLEEYFDIIVASDKGTLYNNRRSQSLFSLIQLFLSLWTISTVASLCLNAFKTVHGESGYSRS